MERTQIAELVNGALLETTGESALLTEDLSNVVDTGKTLANIGNNAVDAFTGELVDRIAKTIFVSRAYVGRVPSVIMNDWEYGGIMQKVSTRLLTAQENQSFELRDGQSYDPNIFHKPEVVQRLYNNRVTFDVPQSIARRQVTTAFNSAAELNGFVSMLMTAAENTMNIHMDNLVMRTINNMVAESIHSAYGSDDPGASSNVRVVNLLYLYNQTVTTPITAADAITNPDFLRFAAYTMRMYVSRMAYVSTLFNIGGEQRFTPRDRLKIVLLDEFASAADVYLYSNTFHDEMTKFPVAETVPYWQGSGTTYGFANTSTINIRTSEGNTVEYTGVLGAMFDRDALGVAPLQRWTESQYVAPASFTNYWYKLDAGLFNDFNENMVVFICTDAAT